MVRGDRTAEEAIAAGAEVLVLDRPGKGEAVSAGIRAVGDAEVVVLIDADLKNLSAEHVDRLAAFQFSTAVTTWLAAC